MQITCGQLHQHGCKKNPQKTVWWKPYAWLSYIQACDKYLQLLHHLNLRLGGAMPSIDNTHPC